MRVVCDNCGAVYKIADSKLNKEVNRATCKRCGHKIIIYKPGSPAAENAAAHQPDVPAPLDNDEERTVIKSVPELKKLVQSQQGVPTIGSLTAELRAISIPGVQPVQVPQPGLGPQSSVAGPGPVGLDSLSSTPLVAPPPPPPLPQAPPPPPPVVRPPAGIPPSDSPNTAIYDGPRAAASAAPPPPPPGTRPGPPLPAAPSGPHPPVPGGPTNTTVPPRPKAPPLPPLPQRPVPPPIPGGPPPGRPTPPSAVTSAANPRGVVSAAKTGVAPAGGPNPVLGTVAVLGLFALAGLFVGPFLASPINAAAYGFAGFGAAGCLLLALVTDRGANPSRAPIALILALLFGGLVGGVHYLRAQEVKQPVLIAPTLPPVQPPPSDPLPPEDSLPGDELPPEGEGEGELSASEAEELNKYSDSQVSGLGRGTEPAATLTPRRVLQPEATPRPRATPRPTPKPTPKPDKGPTRATPKQPKETASKGSSGPSRFVIDTIMKNNATIIRCLKVEQARGADLSGKIYVKFSISSDGTVSRARVTTSRFAGTALDTCISNEVNSLKFPPFDGKSKQITYPLIVE